MVGISEDVPRGARAESTKITASPFDPFVRSVFPRLADRVPPWVSPNAITVAGVLAAVAAGVAVALAGRAPALLLLGALLVLVNWVADTLDGIVARRRGQSSRLGDFLDHAFDAVTVAALTVGPAFSGLVHPTLSLLQGVLILLGFAFTYKGEQATGVYELLALGPTEIRFALVAAFVTAYLVPGTVVTALGHDLAVLDLAAAGGCLWAVVYGLVLFRRYVRRLEALDS